jgi:hypothetical protein
MLLTELILSKDNVLSQVWIAAHYERKLSKQQALKISVQDSVGAYRVPLLIRWRKLTIASVLYQTIS